MSTDLARDLGVEAAKAAPPVVVSAYAMLSTGLPVVIGLATLLYIILQAAHLAWKWWCQARDRRAAIAAHLPPARTPQDE